MHYPHIEDSTYKIQFNKELNSYGLNMLLFFMNLFMPVPAQQNYQFLVLIFITIKEKLFHESQQTAPKPKTSQ